MDDFLTELEALYKKYGVIITGCGCCGSPFLYSKDEMIQHGEDEQYFEAQSKENIEHLRAS